MPHSVRMPGWFRTAMSGPCMSSEAASLSPTSHLECEKLAISSFQSLVTKSLILCAVVLALSMQAQANDSMFPALPAAASSIGWQGNYFVVNGKPTILWSGSIHYARIPREQWRERLIEAKRAGINTIQSYVSLERA